MTVPNLEDVTDDELMAELVRRNTAPTVHTTPAELHTELFWAEHIQPIARAHGFDAESLQMDGGDRHRHLLKAPDGRVVLVVRTDREPLCCPYHDRYPGFGSVSCEKARIDPGVIGHPEVYGTGLLAGAPEAIKRFHGYREQWRP